MSTMNLIDVPLKSKIMFGTYRSLAATGDNSVRNNFWKVVGKNLPGFPRNSVVLMSSQIVGIAPFNLTKSSVSADYGALAGYEGSVIDQWLNSDKASSWYTVKENQGDNLAVPVELNQRPGFMWAFTKGEKDALLPVKIKFNIGREEKYITRKVFIPSAVELGSNNLFTSNYDHLGNYFSGTNFYSNIQSEHSVSADIFSRDKLSFPDGRYRHWVRDTDQYRVGAMNWVSENGNWNAYPVGELANQVFGILPIVCLAGDSLVSYREGGGVNYTVITNGGVSTPSNLKLRAVHPHELWFKNSYPNETAIFDISKPPFQTAFPIEISFTGAIHYDDENVFIRIERAVNGGGYTEIFEGFSKEAVSFLDKTHGKTATTVRYRVCAFDKNRYLPKKSSYIYSDLINLKQTGWKDLSAQGNNSLDVGLTPDISNMESSLKKISSYSDLIDLIAGLKITQKKGQETSYKLRWQLDVRTSAGDGETRRQQSKMLFSEFPEEQELNVSSSKTEQKLPVGRNEWLKIPNGMFNLNLMVYTSDGGTAFKSLFLRKGVDGCSIELARPLLANVMPKRISLNIQYFNLKEKGFKILACNNGFDTNPTWENITESVKRDVPHLFINKSKTAPNWGVSIKVLADVRHTGYISAIGGAFE